LLLIHFLAVLQSNKNNLFSTPAQKIANPQVLHGSLIMMAKLEEAQGTPSHMKWAFLSVAIL
jgi:hypothetical protein